jgi:Gpi18-like mannosyltransferase
VSHPAPQSAPRRAKEAAASLFRDPSFRAAFAAFAVTRLLILALVLASAQLTIVHPDPDSDYGNGSINFRGTRVTRILRARASRGDGNWYMSISQFGYDRRPYSAERQANWAFFPVYPLLLRAAARLTGDMPLTGVLLSTLLLLPALFLLHRTALAFGLDAKAADRTVFYVAAFPVSYFFSLPLTESLFLLLTVGSFYAAKRERWLVAGLLGALASATRVTGVLLFPALALVYWETYRTLRPRLNFLPLLLVPAGLLSFMFFLYRTTGNAFAFRDITVEAWGRRPQFFLTTLLSYLTNPLVVAEPWDFRLLNFLAASAALACGLVLLKRRAWSLACYALASTLVALSNSLLHSQARYAMVVFPAFMVVAAAARTPRIDQVIRTVFLILLTLMTLLYSMHVDTAMA